MKYTSLIMLLVAGLTQQSLAQNGAEMLQKYQTAIRNYHTIDYTVQRIDTFGVGDVEIWNHLGHVILQRNAKSKLLGANFLSSHQDMGQTYYYNGNIGFELDDKAKTFAVVKEIYAPRILGSPAGQMLVEELLALDTTYEAVSYSKSIQGKVLHFKYPDQPALDVLERHTYLVLDEVSNLPQIVRTSVIRGGRRWVTTKYLSALHIDDVQAAGALQYPSFLTDYTPSVVTTAAAPPPSLLGRMAPAFQVVSLAKKSIKLSDYRGKVVVLDFWETFCAPCVTSMPKLQQLQDHYGDKLVVVGMLLGANTMEQARGILRRQHATYLNVVATKAEEFAYQVRGFPRYIVIGKNGKVLFDKEGGNAMEDITIAVERAIGK